MNIYFAAPMFAKSDLLYNAYLVNQLREKYPEVSIYLPQENEAINDKTAYADSQMIALADTEKVLESQLMIALLDGITIDAGVASEIGVAYAKNIPILGLYTDTRQQGADNQKKIEALQTIGENQFHYLNLYTTGLIKLNGTIYASEEELLTGVSAFIDKEQANDI
uniref:nucleoside 2-deoxyribosyltransferase n=1 Tax=Candidatus Enterococcus willemsii TaxID=1857215 RepID=UPI00403F825C